MKKQILTVKVFAFVFIMQIFMFEAEAKKKQPYLVIDTLILNTMDKKTFDVEEFEKNKEGSSWRYIEKDGTSIRAFVGSTGYYYVEEEPPPNPKLYQIYREYYLSGRIKKVCLELRSIPVSIQKEYDEEGNLIKEINWDEDYGKFDYNKVMLFLHKKGHINIETGKGRDDLGLAYKKKENLWNVTILPSENNGMLGYYYYLDGNSGKVKKSGRVRQE